MSATSDLSLIDAERIRSVFDQAPVALSVLIINATLVSVVLAPVTSPSRLTAWAGVTIAVSVARWLFVNTYRRRPAVAPVRRWAAFSVAGALVAGALWGTAAVVLFPPIEVYQFFLALVIAGMCAGALAVNAAHLPTVVAFILPSCLPLAFSFWRSAPPHPMAALMVAIFVLALSIIAIRSHRAFGEHTRLRIALNDEQRKLSATNERLRTEITQRRSAEAILQQAQKMEAIGHLTGGIAHDFNNLLQVMIGNLGMIRRLSDDRPRVLDYAIAAEQAARRGGELTSSLLTFARRQSLEAVPVDVNDLVREFEPILSRTVTSTIRFQTDLTPGLPACLADPAHFQSAILNLVINARDAMPDGGSLVLRTGHAVLTDDDLRDNPDAIAGPFVGVSVRDTGTGMNDAVLAKVFEPFFTTKEVGKGTGLGLSQVYGFVRQSGGHVRIASQPGAGTTATVWLPVSPA